MKTPNPQKLNIKPQRKHIASIISPAPTSSCIIYGMNPRLNPYIYCTASALPNPALFLAKHASKVLAPVHLSESPI